MPNRLFYTLKFLSNTLKEYKYNLNISFKECLQSGMVISLSDSQILKSLRDITGQKVDLNQLEEWYSERDALKKKKNLKSNKLKIKELQKNIYEMMYIPQYVTVVMESEKDYDRMFKKNFILNGKKFKRFSCSASQARVSTIVFIQEEYHEELKRRLDCGRDLNKALAPSKYNAYFGLYSSAIKEVTKPRFCIIKDCIKTRPVDVDFVIEQDYDKDDIIEQRNINVDFNIFDGSGLISPQMAEIWSKDIGEDFVPCQFCIRCAFTKGMVNEFDFVDWCKENNNGNYFIEDIYGNVRDLREIDVILTEGMTKLWDSWESQEHFEESCAKNKIVWGVTKYSPKKDKDVLWTNYQFLQTLDLNDESIERLCKDTVDYIQGVSYDNIYYSLLFLLGDGMDEENIKKYMKNSDNYWMKSLILNHNLLNDKYTKERIRDFVVKKIEQACLGKLVTAGNFQCIVPDSYAFMEWATGQEVKGLLKEKEFYSQYWNEREVNKVDCMRSPLTHFSEHYVVNLKNDEKMKKWFKYSYSGMIVNVHDEHTMRFAGSDYDFDIVSSTNNEEFINGIYKNQRVVTYTAKKPKKKIFTEEDLYKADTFSFGTKIGEITNCATAICALIPSFPKGSKERELLENRVKMCCAAQSREIDRTKIGEKVKGLATIWKDYQRREETDTEEQIAEKNFYNSILADKKPYFFRYKYKNLNKDYKDYILRNDRNAFTRFGISLQDIINTPFEDLSEEQKTFIKYYYKHLPVIDTDCVMNKICKYIESINFKIKEKIKSSQDFDYRILQTNNFILNKKLYEEIKEEIENTFSEWAKKRKMANQVEKVRKSNLKNDEKQKFEKEIEVEILKSKLLDICSNEEKLANHLVYYFYCDKVSSNKNTLWELVGKQLYFNIKNNVNSFYFPIKNQNGSLKYLYENYSIERIKLEEEF